MITTSAFYFENILIYTALIPLIGILLLLCINSEHQKLLKIVALNFSTFPFLIFVLMWGGFKKSVGTFQFVTKLLWIPILNLNVSSISVDSFVIGLANEKVKGPTGVNQSSPNPTELLMPLLSSELS